MADGIFAPDFAERSYWLTSAPPSKLPDVPLPSEADVLVIGAGLTGLAAGHDLARAGRSVLIIDAEDPGEGASARNAGMLGRNTKHSFLGLKKSSGEAAAIRFFSDLHRVFETALDRIRDENLPCDYQQAGRVMLAHTPEQFAGLRREYEARAAALGEKVSFLKAGSRAEVASDCFTGAVYIHDNACVHAGKYTQSFIARARTAGAVIAARTCATKIIKEGNGFRVITSKGQIKARDVLVCTNGYSGALLPWIDQRLIQIESYLVATEALPPEVAASVFPNNRTYMDSTRRPFSMRLSPDGTRILFGARTGEPKNQPIRETAKLIYRDLTTLFPQLRGYRLANAWGGRCSVTWDHFPHVGQTEGIHYALGYNFSGLAMAPHLGELLAKQVLGRPEASDFHARSFPKAPYPTRAFDAFATRRVIRYYGWRDHASMHSKG